MKKSILITGAGTGIGRASAIEFAARGHRVYATTVNQEQASELNDYARSHNIELESFKLDVTNEQDRLKVANIEVDVLLNNAGVGYSGSLAEIELELVRKNFEINVFAAIRLSQIVLAGMIQRRRGTVMFVSSIAGRITAPFMGAYCMTKHALEAAAESLRGEMDALGAGIQVCLIEPGPYLTGFNQQIMGNKFSWMDKDSYFADQVESLKASDKAIMDPIESSDISSIIEKIVTAGEAQRPDLRYFAPDWLLPMVKEHEAKK